MANKKFTDLLPADALPTLTGTDILAVTVDPNGATPVSNKTTIANLMGQAPVQSVNTATGAVVLDADDIDDSSTTNKFVTASDITNLSNLSGTNSGDQDLSSYQLQPAESAFVDGDKTKLDGIEALADVTDATNVEAAGALMDNEVTNLAQVKAFDSADYASATHTHAIDDLSDVTITSAQNEDVIKFNGTSFVNGQVSVDVDTPLTTALRGTDNPHIGAYPNQSFKVTDNPFKSVMVIADADGNLEFVTKDGANVFVNTPSSRLALAKGFSVQEDGDEPDIEAVTPSGVTYSVISGDSDTKGANGLPIRQGFNYPDIGANPAPLLISGGSIA
jgi:hypothetical protein